jgi:hypothetical protein
MAEQQTQPQQVQPQQSALPERRRRVVHPWWKSKVVVTLLGTLAAAVAPLTVGVQNYIEKQKQLAIAEREQDFKMRMAYLDLAIDPTRTPADRAIVLRFLKDTTHDPALSTWANNELGLVNEELGRLEAELKAKLAALAAQAKAEEEAKAKLEALRGQAKAPSEQVQKAETALAEARGKKESVEAETEEVRNKMVPGATLKATSEAEGAERSSPRLGPPLLSPRAMAGASASPRCEPGTVKARPMLGISQEAANSACEQALQDGAEPARRMIGLLWETRLAIGQREGNVTCICRPAS